MSESAQPLSRRERRALEEAAAAAQGEVTQALPVAPESISVMSRRERRRLERLQHPLETWTPEEEMIATGQMPAMTPELLAKQEKILAEQRALEAEKAAKAQADAEAAYAQTAPEPVVERVSLSQAAAPEPEPVAEAEPVAEPEPVAEAEPVEEAPAPTASEHHDGIPAELRHLFPPGSLQARGLEAQAAAETHPVDSDAVDEIRRLTQEAMAGISRATHHAEEVAETPASQESPLSPQSPASQPTPVSPQSPAEPHDAFTPQPLQAFPEPGVAQPDHAEPVHSEPVRSESIPALSDEPAPQAPTPQAPTPQAPAAQVPGMPLDVEELWNTPTVEEPERPQQDAVAEPVNLDQVPLVQDVPHTTEPKAGEAPGTSAVWDELVPSNARQAPAAGPLSGQGGVGFAPAGFASVASQQQAAPTMWDTHPLVNPGATPVRELPNEPVQRELPRPDLTQLLNPQASPSVGPAPYASTEPLTTTGALPNRAAEPIAGGGARHFRWAHLAVIGAIAFVLGVLAWNIAKGQ